jgi:hypothetical protein
VGFIHVLNKQNQLDFEIGNKILEKILEKPNNPENDILP